MKRKPSAAARRAALGAGDREGEREFRRVLFALLDTLEQDLRDLMESQLDDGERSDASVFELFGNVKDGTNIYETFETADAVRRRAAQLRKKYGRRLVLAVNVPAGTDQASLRSLRFANIPIRGSNPPPLRPPRKSLQEVLGAFRVQAGTRAQALIQSGFLDSIGERIDRRQIRKLARTVGIQLPGDPDSVLARERFRQESLNLIKSLTDHQVADLSKQFQDQPNLHPRDLSKLIQARFNVSKSRAKLIARDQVLTFQARVREDRMKQAGVTRYIWTTSKDERVRSSHRDREGEIYSWDNPPEGGHPGTEIQCRCTPYPVLDS